MPIGNERGVQLFEEAGALVRNVHVRLAGGRDAMVYVAKARMLDPINKDRFEEICQNMAKDFIPFRVQTIVAPQTGAIKYAVRVAEILSQIYNWRVEVVFAEKCGDKEFYIKPEDKKHIRGRNCGIIEDVLTSKVGGSCEKVVYLVRGEGGVVHVVVVIWNRGRVTKADVRVGTLICQINVPIDDYEPDTPECPGCDQHILYDLELGHGKYQIGHPLGPPPIA